MVLNFTYAYVFMAMKSMFGPDIPNNDGCARPVKLKAPEGSVVNCKLPAAVAARLVIGHFITEIIYRALSGVAPNKVIAASGGTPAQMNVFYGKRNDARPWHSVIIRGVGCEPVPSAMVLMSIFSLPMAPIHRLRYSKAIHLSLLKEESYSLTQEVLAR